MLGTAINVATVAAGSATGAFLGEKVPKRVRETVTRALGLFTLVIGAKQSLALFSDPLSQALGRASVLVVLASLLLGGIAGEVLRLEERLEGLGNRLRTRLARTGSSQFAEGFLLASLVFCVGPMTIIGSLQDGLSGDYTLLLVKATMDGFAALAFASVLGWGVLFSALTVLVYQGSLTLAAAALRPLLSPAVMDSLSATGGILILAIGLRLLEVAEVRVGNLLPALLLSPLAVLLWGWR